MKQFQILVIGEVMAEIRSCDAGQPKFSFAGDTYNTAVYAHREMGSESGIAYVSRIGCDPLSLAFMQRAGEEGINVSHVRTDSERNIGIYSVSTDDQGERSFQLLEVRVRRETDVCAR